MKDLITFVFFIFAAIFFISYVQENASLLGGSNTYSSRDRSRTHSTAAYTRSYDDNHDGFISDTEYQQGELDRIEIEIAEIAEEVEEALIEQNRSIYYGMVTFGSANVRTEESRSEYITLKASRKNNAPIVISGWKLKSLVTGITTTIPKGVVVLEGSRPWKREQNVFLAPGESAIVNSRYAVGINTGFLENKCTGYLDRGYDFSPGLGTSCPLLKNEDLLSFGIKPGAFDDIEDYDACLDAIEDVGRCDRATYDSGVPRMCRTFINKYATYSGCLELHKTDSDFLGDRWRLFLVSSKDLWRSQREAIVLIDDAGKVVDILEYR